MFDELVGLSGMCTFWVFSDLSGVNKLGRAGSWPTKGNGVSGLNGCEIFVRRSSHRLVFDLIYLPARITSTPAGNHLSPGLSKSRMVLAGSVRKYSASSTWVPSFSRTTRTVSAFGRPSLSLPRCRSSSSDPTTSPLRTLRRPSHNLKGLFPRDSCNTPISAQHTARSTDGGECGWRRRRRGGPTFTRRRDVHPAAFRPDLT